MTKTNGKNPLAGALRNLAKKGDETDNVAATILTILHGRRIRSLDAFNDYVAKAYAENGWRAGAGRPKEGETYEPVPKLVRVYISEIRAAFRLELPVQKFKTMKSLRDAVADARRASIEASQEEEDEPELEGVLIRDDNHLTGGLFHDLGVIYRVLSDEDRERLENSVERLVKKYKPLAIPKLSEEPRRLTA